MRVWSLSILVLAAILLSNQPVQAQEMCPEPMMSTIASLEECVVVHALTMGHIDSVGIANSLSAKLQPN